MSDTEAQAQCCVIGAEVHIYRIPRPGFRSLWSHLILIVVPPAFHPSVIEDRTGESFSCGNSDSSAVRAQVYRGQIITHVVLRISSGRGVPPAELPIRVVAPALQRSTVKQSASVLVTRCHSDCNPTSTEIDGKQLVPHLVGLASPRVIVTLTQLAFAVLTPAL